MARGHAMPELTLTIDERDTLQRWARRRPTTAQALAQRARMILACAEGRPNHHVARLGRVTRQTVGRWRARFVSKRLDGLLDEPRPGAPRCSSRRSGTLWARICIRPTGAGAVRGGESADPGARSEPARVANAAGRGRAALARLHAARHTTTLFAALNAKSGKVISEFHRRQRAREFRTFLDTIHARVPATLTAHLILDNSSTHKTPAIHHWLARHTRVHMHFTPTGSSWINRVERWFAALTEKQLRRGVHRSTRELETAISRYVEITNGHPKPLVWTKTADEILESGARFCHRISNSGH